MPNCAFAEEVLVDAGQEDAEALPVGLDEPGGEFGLGVVVVKVVLDGGVDGVAAPGGCITDGVGFLFALPADPVLEAAVVTGAGKNAGDTGGDAVGSSIIAFAVDDNPLGFVFG